MSLYKFTQHRFYHNTELTYTTTLYWMTHWLQSKPPGEPTLPYMLCAYPLAKMNMCWCLLPHSQKKRKVCDQLAIHGWKTLYCHQIQPRIVEKGLASPNAYCSSGLIWVLEMTCHMFYKLSLTVTHSSWIPDTTFKHLPKSKLQYKWAWNQTQLNLLSMLNCDMKSVSR